MHGFGHQPWHVTGWLICQCLVCYACAFRPVWCLFYSLFLCTTSPYNNSPAHQAAEADALLSKYAPSPAGSSSTSPIDAARPALLRAQLALEAGNVPAALQLMQEGLPQELRMRPAVVATRVSLLEQVRCGSLCVLVGFLGACMQC